MIKEQVFTQVSEIVGKHLAKLDEPMAGHTSFNIGGPADIFTAPDSIGSMTALLDFCKINGIPCFVFGRGTNILVRDKGIRGVVINTSGQLKHFSAEDDKIEAEAGAFLSAVANAALENGLAGFEFASGIPGTIGGATVMNAGAYGGQMADVVFETTAFDEERGLIKLTNTEHEFGYRESIFQKRNLVILKTVIKLEKGNKEEIKARMDDYNSRRKSMQPLNYPSAGSTFRRTPGYYTGKLIEEAGLKGFRIGGAQVSEKHAGFIVNLGEATAADVLELIELVREKIFERTGVTLIPEIKAVGEE